MDISTIGAESVPGDGESYPSRAITVLYIL